MSEIITCPFCLIECDCNYSFNDNTQVVSQTPCKCPRQSEKEKLNKALKQLAIKFGLKERKVSNAKNQSSTRKVSR